jgi:hypothetical protein
MPNLPSRYQRGVAEGGVTDSQPLNFISGFYVCPPFPTMCFRSFFMRYFDCLAAARGGKEAGPSGHPVENERCGPAGGPSFNGGLCPRSASLWTSAPSPAAIRAFARSGSTNATLSAPWPSIAGQGELHFAGAIDPLGYPTRFQTVKNRK